MPSELSRRLDEFRTKNKVVPTLQKVSFLFDPTRAAGLDVLSLAVIAKKSLFELAKLEPSLAVFEDLFEGTGKSVDFLSQEEHAEVKARISQLLMFLSAHLKSLDCQQCIEYLIQRFQIHVYNGEDLILCALPYHDTAVFGSLVKLVPFFMRIERATPSESRWVFLKNVHKSGSPLSRLALIKMCRSSQPVMSAILDFTAQSLKLGAFSQPLLSFVSTLMMTVLSEFNAIRYDISIMLFSLCRICFKVSSVCPSAYFLGLSLTTSIVCVADIRDDALGLLLTRAVASCPLEKLKSVLMALIVISNRRPSLLPESVIAALHSLDSTSLESAISNLVSQRVVDSSLLKPLVPCTLVHLLDDQSEMIPPPTVVETPEIEESSESSDSSSDEEEESEIDRVRRILTQLLIKGSKRDRLEAIAKYAHVDGATRYCIRLAAACDSVESLALAISSNKSDKGYLEILKSEIGNFTANPRLVLEAAFFGNKLMVPRGSISELASILNVDDAGSIIALLKSSEDDFVLSAGVWKTIAVFCAPKAALKSPLIDQWRTELVPTGFLVTELPERLEEITNRFIEYANNSKESRSDLGSALGQFVSSIYLTKYRKPLTSLAIRSFGQLGIEDRTNFVANIIQSNCSGIIRKFCESFNADSSVEIEPDNEHLIAAITSCFASPMTADSWSLVKVICGMGAHVSLGQMLAGLGGCKTPIGWNCVSSWAISAAEPMEISESLQVIDQILESLESADAVTTQTNCAQIDALLSLFQNPIFVSSLGETKDIKSLVSRTIRTAISFHLKFATISISDSTIVTLQSVCDSVLNLLPFTDSWTVLVSTMGTICLDSSVENRQTIQTMCMILLSNLIGTDAVDTETVTSKELGLLLIGLVDLIPNTEVASLSSVDSWVGHSGRLSAAIEQCLVQYLGNCTLKKLDKMFRKLISQFGQIENGMGKFSLVLRVYSRMCDQGGSAVVLGVIGIVRDMIMAGLGQSTNQLKRRRGYQLVLAALDAIAVSCVQELPETYIDEFSEALAAAVPAAVDAQESFSNACVAVAEVCSSDQIKKFVKSLMTQTVAASGDVQECILNTVLGLWKKVGEPMVPSITEVTVYIGELYKSKDESVRSAAVALVKEIDRRTGEDIQGKLGGAEDTHRMSDEDEE